MRIQVKDFMSSPVVTAVGEKRVQDIRRLMKRKNIHAIPVIEYSRQLPENHVRLRGIVTSTDLNDQLDETTKLEDIMTTNVHIIHKNSSAQAAAKMMMKHKVHHLVVMEDGKIVGMVSSYDFVELVAQHSLE